MFQECGRLGYHLVLDFFRNDWMVQTNDAHKIPVPIITNDITKEWDEGGPFWRKVKELADGDEVELQGSFWTRDSEGERITDDEE